MTESIFIAYLIICKTFKGSSSGSSLAEKECRIDRSYFYHGANYTPKPSKDPLYRQLKSDIGLTESIFTVNAFFMYNFINTAMKFKQIHPTFKNVTICQLLSLILFFVDVLNT